MAWLELRGRAQISLRSVGLAAVCLFALAVGAPASGCSTTERVRGEECVGGKIDARGNCVAICDPSLCLPGNVCVDNVCRLRCTAHEDCYLGVQSCTPALTDPAADGTQTEVTVCAENGHAPVLTNGYPVGWYGEGCVGGDANCATQLGCPNGLECNPQSCADCALDEVACAGKELCNIGKCAATGERCTFNTCPLDQCAPFQCIGWIGEGDTEAYCSSTNCSDDSNCAAGFFCGAVRDPREICGTMTGATPACGEGPTTPCVDPAAVPAGGQFFEGPLCLMQKTCLIRGECSPCAHNIDCSAGSADVCANHFEQTVCARFCNDDGDCAPDETCIPYNAASGTGAQTCGQSPNVDCVTASKDCPVDGDVCVPRNVCVPRAGACDGSNVMGNKFCAHCTQDVDCGGPGSGWACVEQSNGHPACLDLALTTPCMTDSDCPVTPGGVLHGECLDEDEGVDSSSSAYHRCYFPYQANEGFTCW